MRYKCERCGANLDPGETCDCIEKEPPRGNVNGSGGDNAETPSPIIAEWLELVKMFHEPVRALRVLTKKKQEDFVAFARRHYPKFDAPLLCKCENSAEYGVTIVPELYDALITEFAPELMPIIKHMRGGRHKLTRRISGRLPDYLYDAFLDAIHSDGYDTVQDWITHTVSEYMRRRGT